jgi:asparagine synthetase B (glutamine-hydrolysing)
MAGISGFVSNGGAIQPERFLLAFEDVHRISGVNYVKHEHATPHCVLQNLLTGYITSSLPQPALSDNGKIALILEGEVYNIHTLQTRFPDVKGRHACDFLLALFLRHGREFVSLLDGRFNMVIFDANQRKVWILNDLFASKSMYYSKSKDGLVFASEKKAILAVSETLPQIDPIGLLQMFAHIHNLSGRTFLEGIQSLPPATCLEYENGKITLYKTRQLTGIIQPLDLDEHGAIRQWAGLLQEAVKKCLVGKERIVLQLSGGLDSRAIACAVNRTHRPFLALTRGRPGDLDLERGKAIAEKLGLVHYPLELSNKTPIEYIDGIVWRTECQTSFEHSRSIANHKFLKDIADFIMSGQFGDISSGRHIQPYMFKSSSRGEFIWHVFQRYSVSLDKLKHIFSESFLQQYYPGVREQFSRSFENIDEEDNIGCYQIWDQTERQANFILRAGNVDSHMFESIYPFLDWNYLEFLRSLPRHWLLEQSMYKAVIYHLGPEIRRVPSANDGLCVQRTVFRNKLNALLRKKYRYLQNHAPLLRARSPVPTRVSSYRREPGLKTIIQNYLDGEYFDSAIFNRPGISAILNEESNLSQQWDRLLYTLASFAVGLPMFVHNRVKTCPVKANSILKIEGKN